MTPPQELIERGLRVHGDALYRAALLLAGDDQGAERLLRASVAALIAAPPITPPDEADLLARLLAAARAAEAKRASKRRAAARPPADISPIERSLWLMPAERRLALGLHLLLGYDVARLARVLATDESSARAGLIEAMHAIAPAARVSLTDRTSGDHCLAVREALVDPAGRLRHAPAIRGHLAGCAHCRAFDLAWSEISQAAETTMRATLRDRTLPAGLEAQLLAMARPARRRLSPRLRLALPPLAVLLVIAALVLPGITRQPVTVVNRDEAAPVDPQELISRSLAIHASPPAAGGPIWHARFQTFWYFDNNTMAPLHADLWLDRTNPARHRVQLTHASGGAPYELQIGNGTDRLYYALDGIYAPSLYGSLPLRATQDAPALISAVADSPTQAQALADRVTYGVWDIPPFYLKQAQQADDLRVLGRQRDGDRTVQILSFSGLSPMGHPADAPGATAEKVTVLLGLDVADGRLRSATELAGPPGGTQTSRVTWKLLSEESFGSAAEAGDPFDIGRAWNGRGEFPEARSYRGADPALPLISADRLADPVSFLGRGEAPLWFPAEPPAGVDRALLVLPSAGAGLQGMPQALIYLGPDRRLIMRFNAASRMSAAEQVERGPWSALLEPGRARSYRAVLVRQLQPPANLSAPVLIDAHGFSRAELLAVIESLRPLDAATLSGQSKLFARSGDDAPEARAALLGLLDGQTAPDGMVSYTRLIRYQRHGQADPRRDPYHDSGLPETALYETWSFGAPDGGATLLRVSDPSDSRRYWLTYVSNQDVWRYNATADALAMWPRGDDSYPEESDLLRLAVVELLTGPGDRLQISASADGSLISRSAPLDQSSSQYWFSLQSVSSSDRAISADGELLSTTEVQLAADGAPVEVRTRLAAAPGQTMSIRQEGAAGQDVGPLVAALLSDGVLVGSIQQIERRQIPIAEAPQMLTDGQPPQALIMRDYYHAPPSSSIRVTPASPVEALSLIGARYYAPPADMGQINALEVSLGGMSDNSAPFDLGESPLQTAVNTGLANRAIYTLRPADERNATYQAQIIQGEAHFLRPFLASASFVPWDRSDPLRLNVAGRERDVWEASGFQVRYLMFEVDGQLIIISAADSVPAPELYALASRLQIVE